MEERGADEPWHQGRVLDGVPRPVAAPAELLVGPLHAEGVADGEEQPGEEHPLSHRDDPLVVEAPGDERGDVRSRGIGSARDRGGGAARGPA